MLHLIFQASAIVPALQRAGPGDAAFFLGSAVFGLGQNGGMAAFLREKSLSVRFYVLADDLAVRGIGPDTLVAGIETADYRHMVSLAVTCDNVQSWN